MSSLQKNPDVVIELGHQQSSSSSNESRAEIKERGRGSSGSELDLESGEVDEKVNLTKDEKDCRICHLGLDATNQESGMLIELGCSCKEDLAAAHKHCAEAWFKIKGNKICEICGSIARNIAGANEADLTNTLAPTAAQASAVVHPIENRNLLQGHRLLNFLLACMVFAFVISWLFHFNLPS